VTLDIDCKLPEVESWQKERECGLLWANSKATWSLPLTQRTMPEDNVMAEDEKNKSVTKKPTMHLLLQRSATLLKLNKYLPITLMLSEMLFP
jgi:hypothetical protein